MLLVFDGSDVSTFQGLDMWVKDVRKYNKDAKILLICNKCDTQIVLSDDAISVLANRISINGMWMKTSAKTGEGVSSAFENVIRLLMPKHDENNSQPEKKAKRCRIL